MSNNLEQLNKPTNVEKTSTKSQVHSLIYCRVSSERQKTDGHGLDSQEHRCKDLALRLGYKVDGVFPDSVTGGGNFMERPAMRALLDYVDKHPAQKYVAIFDDLKRFARDTIFHWSLRSAFKVRNITPLCLNYNFDESPEGTFVETIFAAQNQLDREQNKRQVIQKMKARLDAGYWPFGGKKGYVIIKDTTHGKLAVPNDEGLKMLKPALEDFATGKLIRKVDVCRYLVEKGFWKRQAAERYIDKITAILSDPFYVGDIEYKPWEVSRRKGHHQPIISIETFEAVQKRLKNNGLSKRIRIDTSSDFEHRGLIICDGCQCHLTAAWSKGRKRKHPYYFCQNIACEFYRKSIHRKDIEDRFNVLLKETRLKNNADRLVHVVFDRVWDFEVKNIKYQEIVSEQQVKALEKDIRDFTARANTAKLDHVREGYEMQMAEAVAKLKDVKERPKMQENDLAIPYRTALDKVTGLLKSPYSIWKKLETTEKHQLFYFIFEAKLPYNLKTGYRTEKIQSYARLFEDFATQNTLDVEMGGIGPPSSNWLG